MKIKHKIAFVFLSALAIFLFIFLYPYGADSAILNPKGIIALKERDLIYISTLMMLIIVVPVLIMAFAICLRYRASNKNAEYNPKWNHDTLAEIIWWGFPCFVVLILSILTWKSSHSLDPFKPLKSSVKPIRVQVVALQWKWLFIYPEQGIASVNFIQFPEQTPVNFEITADAPMNSFWIPELGGQIYAMPGMITKLHLAAEQTGDFRGSSANLSGEGFAGMTFIARASSQAEYDEWLKTVSQNGGSLGKEDYEKLAMPSKNNPPSFYILKNDDLFNQIVMGYHQPKNDNDVGNGHE